jgi:peptide/nickel transport system substrate-binding protein
MFKKPWAAVVAAVILVAFAGAAPAGPAESRRGGTVVFAIGADPETLNPGITTGYAVGAVTAHVYSGLLRTDGQGNLLPQLATKWTVAPDGKTYTFTLRGSVKWHDGRPLTAADVKFSMDEVAGKHHGRFRLAYANIESVDTPNPGTVVVRMKQPYGPFLRMMNTFDMPVLPRHGFAGEDILRTPKNVQPVGTGPFVFKEWVRGDRVVLERNPSYWEPVGPDRLIFRIVPNPAQRSTALETGEVDVVTDFYLSKSDVPRLRQNKDLRVRFGQPIPALNFVYVNTRRAPLNNVKVRQALAHAINRDQIVTQSMRGFARPAKGPFGDGFKFAFSPDADYSKLYPFSPQRAAGLLAEAGVNPASLRITFVYDASRAPHASAAQIIRDNLRQIGITVEIVPLERSVRLDRVYVRYDYDLTIESYTSNADPAIGYHRLYLTAQPGVVLVNATGYGNPEVDQLLTQAGQTSDVAARARLYAQANRTLARDIPTIILFDEVGVDAARTHLKNLWQGLDARDAWYLVAVEK